MNRLSKCDPELAREYGRRIEELLDRPGPDDGQPARELSKIIDHYHRKKRRIESIGNARQLKRDLARLTGHFEKLAAGYQSLGADVTTAIEAIRDIRRGVEHGDNMLAPLVEMLETKNAISLFLDRLVTTRARPFNAALEGIVSALLELARQYGLAVEVSIDKGNGNSARLRSPMAEIIWSLLHEVDPDITAISVVNMIRKIRREKAEKPDPLDRVLETFLTGLELERIGQNH
jgi:hypothetical protein